MSGLQPKIPALQQKWIFEMGSNNRSMSVLKKIQPEWTPRIGLGLMYLYSGYDLIAEPQHWYGFIPGWLERAASSVASLDAYLKMQGAGELAIGCVLLAWFLPRRAARAAACLAALEMAGILLFVGIDAITFRDLGLLGGMSALFLIMGQHSA